MWFALSEISSFKTLKKNAFISGIHKDEISILLYILAQSCRLTVRSSVMDYNSSQQLKFIHHISVQC